MSCGAEHLNVGHPEKKRKEHSLCLLSFREQNFSFTREFYVNTSVGGSARFFFDQLKKN